MEESSKLDAILIRFRSNGDSNFNDLDKTEQFLIDSLNTDSNICLICIEIIQVRDAIWNCDGCYAQFHINCIQSWIKDGSYQQQVKDQEKTTPNNIPWNCPKCRKEYSKTLYPSIYYCYCKKVKNPKYDAWSVPHSCNRKCEKSKTCGHTCLILCHPGPCPPCPIMVKSSCYCEKSNEVSRRCSNKHWSCNKSCNKRLPCNQHRCQMVCHAGDCGECSQTSVQECKCRRQRKEVLCKDFEWQCDLTCGRLYSCGNHKCERVCHIDGECGKCPRSMQRTCPCGKSRESKACTEEIAPCGDTCDKVLNCKEHKCQRRCHYGSCDVCRQVTLKRCRCGTREKELACCVEFTCETKCTRLRSCGKHKCNRKCCDGSCVACELYCNKLLSCKIHKCNMLCHQGPCYPCPLLTEVFCPCGSSSVKVPCGRNKSSVNVICKSLCKRLPKCHHDQVVAHRCHANDCPPCSLKCDKRLQCGHSCEAKCHSAVLTEISNVKERLGPWVPLKVEKKILNFDCPPCKYPLKVECVGAHEIGDFLCSEARPYSCGSKCGQLLSCKKHKCEMICHQMDNDINKCEDCERLCEEKRPSGCTHECPNEICHEGECRPCVQLIKLKCNCETNYVYVECNKWINANKLEKETLRSCKVPCTKNKKCGHTCDKLCHAGSCAKQDECESKLVVKCSCKTIKKSFICKQMSKIKREELQVECGERCLAKKRLKMNQKFMF